jgi:hypothetical protein
MNYDNPTFWYFSGDNLLLCVKEWMLGVSRTQSSEQVILWGQMVRIVAELLAHLD